MRTLLVTSAVLIILGTAAVWYGLTRGTLSEWHAGNLPYPGNGFTASDDFELHRGGRFLLQVLSPCTHQENDNRNEYAIPVAIRVVIRGSNGFHLERVIKSLRSGSWIDECAFSPDDVWTLPSGEYEIRIEGHAVPPSVFRDRGAAIFLYRMEDVGSGIGIELSTYVGYVLLGVAVSFLVVYAVVSPRSGIQPQKPTG